MCPNCKARRDMARNAFLNAKMGEAVAHVAKGAAEAVGLKKKTGSEELRAARKPAADSKKSSR